jgi:hypothetical protein
VSYCSLHGKTEQVGVNAYGFAVYKCCQGDLVDATYVRDACARAPMGSSDEVRQHDPIPHPGH